MTKIYLSIVKEEKWPTFSIDFLNTKQINLPIQINGKLKGTIMFKTNLQQEEIVKIIFLLPKNAQILESKKVKKQFI